MYLQYLIVSFHLVGDFPLNHDYRRKGSLQGHISPEKKGNWEFIRNFSFIPGDVKVPRRVLDSILLEYKDSGYNVHIPYIQYFEVYFGCIPNNTQ